MTHYKKFERTMHAQIRKDLPLKTKVNMLIDRIGITAEGYYELTDKERDNWELIIEETVTDGEL